LLGADKLLVQEWLFVFFPAPTAGAVEVEEELDEDPDD
jgi:hypothetical protein